MGKVNESSIDLSECEIAFGSQVINHISCVVIQRSKKMIAFCTIFLGRTSKFVTEGICILLTNLYSLAHSNSNDWKKVTRVIEELYCDLNSHRFPT